jgi:D-aminopeptidase
VINGFGKSAGLIQIGELGTLETPILLTNTLAVGVCFSALARHMLAGHPEIGETAGSVNPVILECNDSEISDLRAMGIQEAHAFAALDAACADVAEGAVGAGTGMICYGLKGGIGSASRSIALGDARFLLGGLALTNFGALRDLMWDGDPVGRRLAAPAPPQAPAPEKGSVIVVFATDAPLSDRQLGRICRRAQSGLARTGSYAGHGSGEIALAFSTANRVSLGAGPRTVDALPDEALNGFFEAAVSVTEECVLSALDHGETVPRRRGGFVQSWRAAQAIQ